MTIPMTELAAPSGNRMSMTNFGDDRGARSGVADRRTHIVARTGRQMRRLLVLATTLGAALLGSPGAAFDPEAYLSRHLQSHPVDQRAWDRMIADAPAPRWLKQYAQLHGSESPVATIFVANTPYRVFVTCKPNDCFTRFAVVFSSERGSAWGAIADYNSEPHFYGSPDPNVVEALRRSLRDD